MYNVLNSNSVRLRCRVYLNRRRRRVRAGMQLSNFKEAKLVVRRCLRTGARVPLIIIIIFAVAVPFRANSRRRRRRRKTD